MRFSFPGSNQCSGSELFQCPECPKSYRHRSNLLRHRRVECGRRPELQCAVCLRRFHHNSTLKRHLGTVHADRRCWNICLTKQEIVCRGQQSVNCSQCGRRYRSKTAMMLHLRVECGKSPQLHCSVCQRLFYHRGNLRRHMLTVHSGLCSTWSVHDLVSSVSTFTCPTCPRVYKSRTALSLHRRVECGKSPTRQCDYCSRRFFHGGDLRRHIKTVHRANIISVTLSEKNQDRNYHREYLF
ncbi:hypothetical protein J6590_002420 [Homalodisca vitripennis]|nr:hypothetical protein J6590_002420 [Homalodisca vitripennis]